MKMLEINLNIFVLTANWKNCHVQYTDTQVSRCSKILRSIEKDIENIFYTEAVIDYIPKASATSRSKIKKFVAYIHGNI